MLVRILAICSFFVVIGARAAAAPTDDIARFEMAFAPTGLAVILIDDGEIRHVHASGVRAAGQPARIDRETRFTIASMGKAFVAAGIAALVDDGKLNWDDPVVRRLPAFRAADPWVTAHLTIRDLLSHRSGLALGAGDLLTWPDGEASLEESVNAVAYLPIEGFRERFIYSNTMYRVAGAVIEAVSGEPWDQFIASRILKPLGMSGCSIDPRTVDPERLASQHTRQGLTDPPKPVADLVERPDPAGGMVCTIEDLGKWALFQLGDGRAPDGARVLSEQRLIDMRQGVIPRRVSGQVRRLAGSNLGLYALGWELSDFHGQLLVEHSGQATGGLSHIALLPGRKAAAVTVANDAATPVATLNYQLLARLAAGNAAKDWIGDLAARLSTAPQSASAAPAPADVTQGLPLSAAQQKAYVGVYRDPWYGDILVTQRDGVLRIHLTRSRLLEGPLVPIAEDRFIAQWPNRGLNADADVTFQRGARGKIISVRLKPVSPDTDFSYDYQNLKPVKIRPRRAR